MLKNIEVLTHSSIRIQSSSKTVYLDPFQLREEPHDADFIFITHDHYDHFSPEDIQRVCKEGTILVVPEKMAGKAEALASSVARIYTVKPGTYHEVNKMEFETVPAYNLLKPFHPKSAEWVGYILRMGGKRIYITGDTDLTKEAKQVKCDILLVPVGGTYTMDAKKAAELANAIEPERAIPTHYGTIAGKPEDADTFADNVYPHIKVEIIKQY
ncbi:MAG: MBL fold metallo-hydrolase [Lachnospiraceae bacterium]|nr:MBL fold metallo-hydrolase [Lachnospiraceae bacterium]